MIVTQNTCAACGAVFHTCKEPVRYCPPCVLDLTTGLHPAQPTQKEAYVPQDCHTC